MIVFYFLLAPRCCPLRGCWITYRFLQIPLIPFNRCPVVRSIRSIHVVVATHICRTTTLCVTCTPLGLIAHISPSIHNSCRMARLAQTSMYNSFARSTTPVPSVSIVRIPLKTLTRCSIVNAYSNGLASTRSSSVHPRNEGSRCHYRGKYVVHINIIVQWDIIGQSGCARHTFYPSWNWDPGPGKGRPQRTPRWNRS